MRALGGKPPEGFNYELFLDEKGQKISKSKGNGLTIEEWLTYASPESLSLFMYQKPTAAKRLYFDVIPRAVDEYLALLEAYPRQGWRERLGNPVWHIHAGAPPAPESCVTRARAAPDQDHIRHAAQSRRRRQHARSLPCCGASCAAMRRASRRKIIRVSTSWSAMRSPIFAISCVRKSIIARADAVERDVFDALSDALARAAGRRQRRRRYRRRSTTSRATIPRYQDLAAKGATPERPGVSNDFFNMLYEMLLGEKRGPRFGSFVALYGIDETRALIGKGLRGLLASSPVADI